MKSYEKFCHDYGLRIPVVMAPMAGASPPALAAAVCQAGGMGACGALLLEPDEIEAWVSVVRAGTNGAFHLNTWIPDPEPKRDAEHEARLRMFLSDWGPPVSEAAADAPQVDFQAQCDAMIAAGPRAISSIMGLYPEAVVARMKAADIRWFATVTTVHEALAAEAAGADALIAQGMEAGGHRGAFNAGDARDSMVGLFALLPAVVDAVDIPVIATGGIADGRSVAAAITLGASAVQIGTGLLRTDEANTPPILAAALANARPESTTATTAFSGRLGRSLTTPYTLAAADSTSPEPAPYPVQRNLTAAMRKHAVKSANLDAMQAWAGQSAAYAREGSAAEIVSDLWIQALGVLSENKHRSERVRF